MQEDNEWARKAKAACRLQAAWSPQLHCEEVHKTSCR